MATKSKKLSRQEKELIANRINYFRTMPSQVRNTASDLDGSIKAFNTEVVTHEIKSVLVGGRIMLLNCAE